MTTERRRLSWRAASLLRDDHSALRSQIATNRLISTVAGLDSLDQVSLHFISDGTGSIEIVLNAWVNDDEVAAVVDAVNWIGERTVDWVRVPDDKEPTAELSALAHIEELLPAVRTPMADTQVQFPEVLDLESRVAANVPRPELWPMPRANDGMELLRALRTSEAQIRIHMAPAAPVEEQFVAALTRHSVQALDPETYDLYVGSPVRVRAFVARSEGRLSPRLRAVLDSSGVGLQMVTLDASSQDARDAWAGKRDSLSSSVQPFGAVQCLLRVPAAPEHTVVIGLETRIADTESVPTDLKTWPEDGLRVGHAIDTQGTSIEVRLGLADLVLHTQVLGVPGSGKSTLLAALAGEAVSRGLGLTVLEGHGTLVNRIIDELPESATERTAVVRSGDPDNPVRLNPVGPDNTGLMENVFLEVLYDVFDPQRAGIIGPRFERIYGQIMQAQRVLLGDRTNVAAVPAFLSSIPLLERIVEEVAKTDNELASSIRNEITSNRSSEMQEVFSWVNSKFQRYWSNPLMRQITSTGEDAVDVTQLINDQNVLLVDLATTELGTKNSLILGEMWLAKHWAAMGRRQDSSKPHLLTVDEAHLFGAGLLPRLLAEARKFGIAVVLAHQNLEQLAPSLREAALSTTNNVVAFRSGPSEAQATRARLGEWPGGPLTRLARLSAASTLSCGRDQSEPFTLIIDHNERVAAAPRETWIGDRIEEQSRERFVDPFRNAAPIGLTTIETILGPKEPPEPLRPKQSDFLEEWRARRKAHQSRVPARDEAGTADPADNKSPADGGDDD